MQCDANMGLQKNISLQREPLHNSRRLGVKVLERLAFRNHASTIDETITALANHKLNSAVNIVY